MRLGLAALALFTLTSTQLAAAPKLAQPIDCRLGEVCYIQQYVDQDTGPGVEDFTCGGLSYDGHKGTDFRLPSFAAMRAGISVLASAKGVVVGTRNNVPDTGWDPSLEGRECGNGVLIKHDDGWETQYCHMEQGSITVSKGDQVTQGAVLGRVGYSGRTQFPHVHLSVRKDGKVIDPFNPDGTHICGQPNTKTLWQSPIDYQDGALLNAGFLDHIPDFDAVQDGAAATRATLPKDPAALVIWAYAFGAQKGDVIGLRIIDPKGDKFFSSDVLIKNTQAQLFRAGGRHLAVPLASGDYQGLITLTRNGQEIDQLRTQLRVLD